MTTLLLKEIKFPVYRIRENLGIREESKITFVTNCSNEEKIIDNKNLVGDTLGLRRLRISKEYIYPLDKAIPNLQILLKYANHTFIDTYGKVFTYKKGSKFYKLTYEKIIRVVEYHDGEGSALVYAQGINYPFTVSYYPFVLYDAYIGLIHYKGGYIYYEVSKEKKKDTRIKI